MGAFESVCMCSRERVTYVRECLCLVRMNVLVCVSRPCVCVHEHVDGMEGGRRHVALWSRVSYVCVYVLGWYVCVCVVECVYARVCVSA